MSWNSAGVFILPYVAWPSDLYFTKKHVAGGTPTVSSENVEKLPLSGSSWLVPTVPRVEQHLRLEENGGGRIGQWPPAVFWTTCRLPEQHAGSLVIQAQFVSNHTTGRTDPRPLRSAKFLTQLKLR